jgi:HSP20 family molecular chaperone IbpA
MFSKDIKVTIKNIDESFLGTIPTNIYEKDELEQKLFFIDAPGVCSDKIEVTANILQEEITVKFKRQLPGTIFRKLYNNSDKTIPIIYKTTPETIEFVHTFTNEKNKTQKLSGNFLVKEELNFKQTKWDYENGVITLKIPKIKSEQPIFKSIPISSKHTNENGSL